MKGKAYSEGDAFSLGTWNIYSSTVSLHEGFGKAETETASRLRAAFVSPVKAIK